LGQGGHHYCEFGDCSPRGQEPNPGAVHAKPRLCRGTPNQRSRHNFHEKVEKTFSTKVDWLTISRVVEQFAKNKEHHFVVMSECTYNCF
jgi:hypothetical protein